MQLRRSPGGNFPAGRLGTWNLKRSRSKLPLRRLLGAVARRYLVPVTVATEVPAGEHQWCTKKKAFQAWIETPLISRKASAGQKVAKAKT